MQLSQLDSSNVTLVLKDGKEIKAGRNELSAASDFFSALFNSDMRESREGVIRLEHITETVMRTVLIFMRYGSVTEVTPENDEDLIEAADYFLLPGLKTLVKSCVRLDLTHSNCISRYCFAEKYLSEDQVAKCRRFIISNFARVAKCQGFLNSEGQRVQQLLHTQAENVLKLFLEEFVRSGDVIEVTTENAERLIVAADYFLLPELKTIVNRCVKLDLTYPNCISRYYFAKKHLSEDHVAKCRNFIISYFDRVAVCHGFLNSEGQQIERMLHTSKNVLKLVLEEFVRHGDVTGVTTENAEHLKVAADYFLLPELKTIVNRCLKLDLTYPNCISRYHFAKEHLSEDHVAKCRKFIISYFDRVAVCHGFLNSEGQQIEQMLHTLENVLKLVLEEFIRSGDVIKVRTETAERLIAAADYFLLPELKTIVKSCVKLDLTHSNCISRYYFAKEHLSEDHVAKCRKFIISYFDRVAECHGFLNSEGQQIEQMLHTTENVLKLVLEEFISSGDVTKVRTETAERLIAAADYFLLPELKTIVKRCVRLNLTVSNCISRYYFAEKHLSEDHVANCRKFIFSNFAGAVECQEFLNLESQQVEQWICSDEMAVNSEKDIFKIILKWIEQKESERKEKFQELFRHLRVNNLSFYYLVRHISTHKLVTQNRGCYRLVRKAITGKILQLRLRDSPRKYLVNHRNHFYYRNRCSCYCSNVISETARKIFICVICSVFLSIIILGSLFVIFLPLFLKLILI